VQHDERERQLGRRNPGGSGRRAGDDHDGLSGRPAGAGGLASRIADSSPTIALDGDTLIVGDDTTGMVLEERTNPPLEGTVWQLEELVSTSAVSAVAAGIAGLTIDAAGTQVQVAAGCNTGSGSVTVEPADDASTGTIDFGPLAMTMKACPEDAMSVEAQVLTVLDGPVDYSIDGSTLTLTKGDAGLLFKGG
jgi:heat shock protein HslJ